MSFINSYLKTVEHKIIFEDNSKLIAIIYQKDFQNFLEHTNATKIIETKNWPDGLRGHFEVNSVYKEINCSVYIGVVKNIKDWGLYQK